MPKYDMHCNNCGYTGEHLVATHSDRVRCPDCGKRNLAKLISTFAIGSSGSSGQRQVVLETCGDHCALPAYLHGEMPPDGTRIFEKDLPCGHRLTNVRCPSGKVSNFLSDSED